MNAFNKSRYGLNSIRYKSRYRSLQEGNEEYELLFPFLKEKGMSYHDARKLAVKKAILLIKFKNRYYFRLNPYVDRDRIKEYI